MAKGEVGSTGFVRSFAINFIRISLLVVFFIAYYYGRDLVLLMALVGFVVTFIPVIIRKLFRISIPAEFEVIVLFFLYGLFLYGEMRWLDGGFWILEIFLNFGEGIILGLVGLSLVYALEDEDIIELSPFVLVFFTFCFAFSLSGVWEIFEYLIDGFFGFGLQNGELIETMLDLIIRMLSIFAVAEFGYYNYKIGRRRIFSTLLFRVVKKNSKFFGSKKDAHYYSTLIEKIIRLGENERIEFKSTLRKNIHTGEIDKKIEHSVLKTVVGFLNSRGGTLLVGVGDSGEILGIENDDFASVDKLRIYVTSLIRSYLGNQYLSYVSFEVYEIGGKSVLKIDCRPSKKRVFLKWNNLEEFYVRHGASTIQLQGSDLIDYVFQRFG